MRGGTASHGSMNDSRSFRLAFTIKGRGSKRADWATFGEEGLSEWEEGEVVPIRWECQVTKAVTLSSWEEVQALDKQHIWTEETVRERFDWEMKGMKGQSLHAAFVSTRILPEPFEVVYAKKHHGGCRSWLELDCG